MIAISGPLFAARDLGTCMHIPDQCWGALAGLCGRPAYQFIDTCSVGMHVRD